MADGTTGMTVSLRGRWLAAAVQAKTIILAAVLSVTGIAAPAKAQELPFQLVAPPDLLLRNFDQVAFGPDFTPHIGDRIYKWAGPLRVALVGADAAYYRRFVEGHLAELSNLTGLEVQMLDYADGSENFYVHFVRQADMLDTARYYQVSLHDARPPIDASACMYAFFKNGRMAIDRSVAIISTDRDPRYIATCILEEIAQALGLPMDTDLLVSSIFSDRGLPQQMSVNDKIMIRALYDPRITPGMPRTQAMQVARLVIPQLVSQYRRFGEVGLYLRY